MPFYTKELTKMPPHLVSTGKAKRKTLLPIRRQIAIDKECTRAKITVMVCKIKEKRMLYIKPYI
jgi:hypothetical protein